MLYRLLRLIHTVKYLKFKQLIFRLLYKFKKVKLSPLNSVPNRNMWRWEGDHCIEQSLYENATAKFLSLSGDITEKSIWNDSRKSKLWLYNLHYFDDLVAVNSLERSSFHKMLMNRWIDENPPCAGIGWEPYTLSLRLVNWIKWWSQQRLVDDKYLLSMAQQADALSQQLEYHLLGNHLFANAKALIFCGAFLQYEKTNDYLVKGLRILDQELPEQFLVDGGHFELSPMYHNIMLWDLLDLIHLSFLTQLECLKQREKQWREIAKRALQWMMSLCHPDGDIAFFNDSALSIAAKPHQLLEYANNLGIDSTFDQSASLTVQKESGYSCIRKGDYFLLVDHAYVGPSYLPGHAHADTLSFELSIDKERVFVNSGTSLYGVSNERLRQRKTESHNTVVVDGKDSSEVWSGFRVARRAEPTINHYSENSATVELSISHDGYKRLKSVISHQRSLVCDEKTVLIEDQLLGASVSADAHFHLHPQVRIKEIDNFQLRLTLPSGRITDVKFSQPFVLKECTWHPRFGEAIPNQKLIVPLENNSLLSTICVKYDQ